MLNIRSILLTTFLVFYFPLSAAKVKTGIEMLMADQSSLKGKSIGLVVNQTSVTSELVSSIDLVKENGKANGYRLAALFAPEHGINGASHASEDVDDTRDEDGIPIYSLHGTTRRPTAKMLKGIDLIIIDLQDIGSRSYTYLSTMCYVMEEAAKAKIPIIVTDRPNPINGAMVDGPLLEDKWRSFVGYLNVPYCHGMTMGELARFFNEEYKIGCALQVIPMQGWKRSMSFPETGLAWIPTSPNIPEASTTFYYPLTGLIGELQLVNIGIGYTMPFKLIGAPWIDAQLFAEKLNLQKLPGVYFQAFYYKPFYGKYANEECQGVFVMVKDAKIYKPVMTQYVIIGLLKSLYPKKFKEAIEQSKNRREMFAKVNGTDEVYRLLTTKQYVIWDLKNFQEKERKEFMTKRAKYLLSSYK